MSFRRGSDSSNEAIEAVDGAEAGPPGDPEEVARIVCLRLLDRRAYTRAELAGALAKRGVPEEAATRVLDRFAEVGLVDDARLADGYARGLHRDRGLAGRAVAVKLRRRGLSDEVVGQALTAIDRDSERAAAGELVERRLRSLRGQPPEVQARRLVGLLARKGYPPGMAYEVVRERVVAGAELDAALAEPAED